MGVGWFLFGRMGCQWKFWRRQVSATGLLCVILAFFTYISFYRIVSQGEKGQRRGEGKTWEDHGHIWAAQEEEEERQRQKKVQERHWDDFKSTGEQMLLFLLH